MHTHDGDGPLEPGTASSPAGPGCRRRRCASTTSWDCCRRPGWTNAPAIASTGPTLLERVPVTGWTSAPGPQRGLSVVVDPGAGEPAALATDVDGEPRQHWAGLRGSSTVRPVPTGRSDHVDRLSGKRSIMYDVNTRTMPERRLLCLKRNVLRRGAGAAARQGDRRTGSTRHRLPRVDGSASAPFSIYWGEVSEDSDGPLRWCRPVPVAQTEALAAAVPGSPCAPRRRTRRAFVHLGPGGETKAPPEWQLVMGELRAWRGHGEQPSVLGTRCTYRAAGPGSAHGTPDCDLAGAARSANRRRPGSRVAGRLRGRGSGSCAVW